MTTLHLADEESARDLAAFTSLAHRLDADGAIRLQVARDILVLTVAPLHPHGIGDSTPLVLGMRMLRLQGSELDGLDEVVPLTSVKDRLARDENGLSLPVPPNSVLASWTGIAPPRGPWQRIDTIAVGAVQTAAEAGIRDVSEGTPQMGGSHAAGSHAIRALRAKIWAKPMTAAAGTELPSGIAFAASGLRFIPDTAREDSTDAPDCPVFSTSGWLRLSTPGGHLLTRARP